MINPKNNSENLKRNIHYKIITQPHPVVYIQCQQKSVKMSDKLHFLWQDKKANKVVKTHWTKFLLGVSDIWYQNNILKTFEKFMLHGSKNYHMSYVWIRRPYESKIESDTLCSCVSNFALQGSLGRHKKLSIKALLIWAFVILLQYIIGIF